YVFKLRGGVKWHNIPPVNGRELTADDIIFSYGHVNELKTFAGLIAGITKMEAVDKLTLKLTLGKPDADFLNTIGSNNLSIVAKEAVEKGGGKLSDPPVIGSGAFVFESIDLQSRFVAKRNPDYYMKGLPYLDGFEGLRNPDTGTITAAFRSGQAHV